MTDAPPPPGSDEALELSCICPVLDNSHGKGFMGVEGYYVYAEGCPLHPMQKDEEPEA
jgi:hypothetical protein